MCGCAEPPRCETEGRPSIPGQRADQRSDRDLKLAGSELLDHLPAASLATVSYSDNTNCPASSRATALTTTLALATGWPTGSLTMPPTVMPRTSFSTTSL